ncbi:MAG TPA: hypothetical protein VGR62_13565 [Candidatus Binatia bacterium]|jgi:hypothetical protein|nr:hypothetical protein [Candidatus Binatia bacterium]
MNTSACPFVSPETRLVACDQNRTSRPSFETPLAKLRPFPCTPSSFTLTRRTSPVTVSRQKTSVLPLVSPGTTFVPSDEKAR